MNEVFVLGSIFVTPFFVIVGSILIPFVLRASVDSIKNMEDGWKQYRSRSLPLGLGI